MSVPQTVARRIALLTNVPAGDLLIHEIYRSLQGESTFAGLPCVFVRLTTCDLRCNWCDTPHAFTQGDRLPRAVVLGRALAFDCPLIEVTGGEPLLQPDVFPLMTELCDAGKTVLLETSGARDISGRLTERPWRMRAAVDSSAVTDGRCGRSWRGWRKSVARS